MNQSRVLKTLKDKKPIMFVSAYVAERREQGCFYLCSKSFGYRKKLKLFAQVYYQLISQFILLLIHVSAVNHSHLQGVTSVEDVCSALYFVKYTS
jgi:hypothetical protein